MQEFGQSVSVSGDIIVVGAKGDNEDTGAAYVFERVGTTWTQDQKLFASDPDQDDAFGVSVSVSGGTVVVGAFSNDAEGSNAGSAYVYTKHGASWSQDVILSATDAAPSNFFGGSVSVSGDIIVVGAYGVSSFEGSAYIFEKSEGSWSTGTKVTGGDTLAAESFGLAVSVSGTTVAVGAPTHTHAGVSSGAVYIFTPSGPTWAQQAELIPGDAKTSQFFGTSLSIDGETIVVGSYGDNAQRGSAYVFTRTGTSWSEEAKLDAPDAMDSDQFGLGVSKSGDNVILGSPKNDDGGENSGSAYTLSCA